MTMHGGGTVIEPFELRAQFGDALAFDDTSRRIILSFGTEQPPPMFKENEIHLGTRLLSTIKDSDVPLSDHQALEDLGDSVIQIDGIRPNAKNIPAAYTYFGQFLAHELTNPVSIDTATATPQVRIPELSFNDLFDPPTVSALDDGLCTHAGLSLRQTHNLLSYSDLPRDSNMRAAIPDWRNCQNLAISQLHVLIVKFHQTVAHLLKGTLKDEEIRQITRRHLQSIVIHDFLNRIADIKIWNEVIKDERGRGWIGTTDADDIDGKLLSHEFRFACFRYGHVSVRNEYRPWASSVATLDDLIKHIQFGEKSWDLRAPAHRNQRLLEDWITPWQQMIAGGPEMSSNAIGPTMAVALRNVPGGLLSEDLETSNLAVRTLLRGASYRLPSGQALARSARDALKDSGREMPEVLDGSKLLATQNDKLRLELSKHRDNGHCFASVTPLWIYILLEAEVSRAKGQHLGPLASRVVLETIHMAVQADPEGIVDKNNSIVFRPERKLNPTNNDRYTLADLEKCVRDNWPHN